MATGAAILTKVSNVIRKTKVSHEVVMFRTVLVRHGNPLLGIGQTRANLDELVDPPPIVELVTPEDVALGGSLLQLGDYRLTFDGNVPEEKLQTCEVLLGDDVLKIVNYNSITIYGTIVGWQVLARTAMAQ